MPCQRWHQCCSGPGDGARSLDQGHELKGVPQRFLKWGGGGLRFGVLHARGLKGQSVETAQVQDGATQNGSPTFVCYSTFVRVEV